MHRELDEYKRSAEVLNIALLGMVPILMGIVAGTR
jgi:hypothetical protein